MVMATTSSPDNYTLGRGRLYFNRRLSSGAYDGERDLGNAPNFSLNVKVNWLEHFSSRSGLKSKDKRIASDITPELMFTLDEVVAENLSMTFLSDITATAQAALNVVMMDAIAQKDRFVSLPYRKLAAPTLKVLETGAVTGGPFVVGETVTGGTSSATGKVVYFDAVGTSLTLNTVTGTFASGETITGGTSGATATSSATLATTVGTITVKKDSTTYTAGTDYVLDLTAGRIYFPSGTTIVEDDTVVVTASVQAYDETVLNGFKSYSVEGILRFVSDNPTGPNMEFVAWSVSLSPDGDLELIGDKWTETKFKGEILRDETGHPTEPYCRVSMYN